MDFGSILQLLWTVSWQIAVVTLAVAAIVKLTCRRQPHLAYALWLVVLLKCITPPLWSSPTGVFSWATARYDASANTARTDRPMLADHVWLSTGPFQAASLTKSADRANVGVLRLPSLLVGLWMLGSAVAICRFIARLASVRRAFRCARIDVPQELLELSTELCRLLGVRKMPQIVVSRQPFGPALTGLLHPKIALPAALVVKKSARELRPMVAHELVHFRRGDLWIALVQTVARIVWWFHPAVWLVDSQLECLREQCCDEEVIAGLNCQPSSYAAMLLDVLKSQHRLRHFGFAPGISPRRVTSDRITHIMDNAWRSRRRAPKRCWLLLAIGSVIVLPAAGIVLRAKPLLAQSKPSDATPAVTVLPMSSNYKWVFDSKKDGTLTCGQATFFGNVTDPAGRPIAGATVRVVYSSLLGNANLQEILNRPPQADTAAGLDTTYKTDAKGRYAVPLVPDQTKAPWPNIGAEISCPGFVPRVFPPRNMGSVEWHKKNSGFFLPRVTMAAAKG